MRLSALVSTACLLAWPQAHGLSVDRRFWLSDSFPQYNYADRVVQNRTSGRMYMGGGGFDQDGALHIFDPGTGRKYGFVDSVGASPTVVHCPGAGRVWVCLYGPGNDAWLYGFDDVADTLVSMVPVGNRYWGPLCYNPARNELYAADGHPRALFRLDPFTGLVRDSVIVAGWPGRMAWDARSDRLFCAQSEHGNGVECIDCATFTSLGLIPGTALTTDLALHPTEPKLYCIAYDDSTDREILRIVNTDELAVRDSIVLPLSHNWLYDGVVDICRRTNRLYCRAEYDPNSEQGPRLHPYDTIVIVDISADTLIKTLGLPDRDDEPRRLAISESTGRVYVGYMNMSYTVAIDQGDSIYALLPYRYADEVCWDSLHNRVYLGLEGGPGDIVLLDGNTDSVVAVEDYRGVLPEQMFWAAPEERMFVTDALGIGRVALDTLEHWLPLHPGQATYSAEANRLYVQADTGDGQHIYAYDCATDQLVSRFALNGGVGLSLMPGANRLFATCSDGTRIYDVMAESVVGFQTGLPWRLSYDPRNRVAYGRTGTYLTVVEPAGGRMLGRVGLGREFSIAAIDTVANELWLGAGAWLLVADCGSMKLLDSVYCRVGTGALAWSPVRRKLYVLAGDSVIVVSAPERRVVRRLDVDCRYDDQVSYDGQHDRLYVQKWDSLQVLDCRSDRVVAVFPMGDGVLASGPPDEVWLASGKCITVFRDIAAPAQGVPHLTPPHRTTATIVRGVLWLDPSPFPLPQGEGSGVRGRAALLDISGRKVLDMHPGANDVRGLAPGVYFVRPAETVPSGLGTVPIRAKVVVTR